MASQTTAGSADSETDSGRPSSKSSPDRGRLIVITGPSGAGKSTVVDELQERIPFHFSVSATTRAARTGERQGVDYRFVDRETFQEMIDRGEFLETAIYNGELYGTPREAVVEHLAAGMDVLLDVELNGAMQVKAAYPEAIVIFVRAPSLDDLEGRLRARGDTSPAEVERRLEIARSQLALANRFDHIVVNDRVERAVDEIVRILS